MTDWIRDTYELATPLARGGQGEVWRAYDHRLKLDVTLKIRDVASQGESEELLREVRTLRSLPHPHPNLPVVREDFSEGQRHYIVMDWIAGTDLDQLLQERGDPGLPHATVLRYLEDAVRALEYLHRHGIVHGDVKPANLVLSSSGSVVLVDFGLARRRGESSAGGTPTFGAPETVLDEPLTPAADVFGLAATAVALLTGRPPEGRPNWDGLPSTLAAAVERALAPALEYAPARRPSSVSELLLDLQAAWRAADLPGGTVTFLLTDVEEANASWSSSEERRRRMAAQHALLREAVERHDGRLLSVREKRDGHAAVFRRPTDAAGTALDVLRELAGRTDPDTALPALRLALHVGEAEPEDGTYRGAALEWCAQLRALAHAGQPVLSESCAQLLRGHLPHGVGLHDLGVVTAPHLQVPEHVFQLVADGLPRDFPPILSVAVPSSSLPVSLTRFVGRHDEMDATAEDLGRHRVVTLTGPPGVGKTRLAIEVGKRFAAGDPELAAFVDLDAIRDPGLVVHAIAKALRVQEGTVGFLTAEGTDEEHQSSSFLTRLVHVVGRRRVLLILDNCDHLVAACRPVVEQLIQTCREVSVLCTSQVPLSVPGETVRRLDPLPKPPGPLADRQTIAASEAVALFLDRAARGRQPGEATDEDLHVVAAICKRLEGVPHAIELAAAWTDVLTPGEILERLEDPLALLRTDDSSLSPSRQSMRVMIKISHDRLSPQAQMLLERLGTFRGSFDFRAVESICGGAGLESGEVLDLLRTLVFRSLVESEPTVGGMRHRLLETTRQYATELLNGIDGERQRLRQRHQNWYLRLAEYAERELEGSSQVRWLNVLELEQDNLQIALEPDTAGDPDADETLRLAAALSPFWLIRGYLEEGRNHLRRALRTSAEHSPWRAKALVAAGELAIYDADLEEARTFSKEALSLAQQNGEQKNEARALRTLSWEAERQGWFDVAHSLARDCLRVARLSGDHRAIGMALARVAALAELEGRFEDARQMNDEALAMRRRAGDLWETAWSLYGVGKIALWQGTDDYAEVCFEEGLAIAQTLNSGNLTVLFRIVQGHGAWRRRELGKAAEYFQQALRQHANVQELSSFFNCLVGLADTATAGQDYVGAAAWLRRVEERNEPLPRYARATVLRAAGRLAAATGDRQRAVGYHREALRIRHAYGDAYRSLIALEDLVGLAVDEDAERAVRLLAVTWAKRQEMGSPVPLIYLEDRERATERANALLEPELFARLWAEGAAMSLSEAVGLELGFDQS